MIIVIARHIKQRNARSWVYLGSSGALRRKYHLEKISITTVRFLGIPIFKSYRILESNL